LYTGSRLFPMACVTGYSRVPEPPARIMPLCCASFVMIQSLLIESILRVEGVVQRS
jgi:hypothetical protein